MSNVVQTRGEPIPGERPRFSFRGRDRTETVVLGQTEEEQFVEAPRKVIAYFENLIRAAKRVSSSKTPREPIEALGLKGSTIRALRRAGYMTIQQVEETLLDEGPKQLTNMTPQFGDASLAEVLKQLTNLRRPKPENPKP